MVKILLDSNIYIALYETQRKKDSIIKDIEKISEYLIITDQIINEFSRKRAEKLFLAKKCKCEKYILPTNLTPYLACNDKIGTDINSDIKSINEKIDVINKKLLDFTKNLEANKDIDIIYTWFKKIIDNKNILIYKSSTDIFSKAHMRNLSGNPPKSLKTKTICDEIIWETILANISDDLIIVSRDGTYSLYNYYLKAEFKEKVDKKLIITENLTDALKEIKEKASKETELFDKESISEEFIERPILLSGTIHATSSASGTLSFATTPLIKCPKCENMISQSLEICPICGNKLL